MPPNMSIATLLFLVTVLLSACAAPNSQMFTKSVSSPTLYDNYFIAHDGVCLPIRTWRSNSPAPKAIIIAVHGFNDYSNFCTFSINNYVYCFYGKSFKKNTY